MSQQGRTTRWVAMLGALALPLALIACGDDDGGGGDTATAGDTATGGGDGGGEATNGIPDPGGDRSLTVGFPATPGFSDIAMLWTIDQLSEAGWDVDSVVFNDQALQTEALLTGQVDVAGSNPIATLTAIQQGAPLTLVGERSANDWIVVSRSEHTSCETLDGQRVAYHSDASVSTFMLRTYIEGECPDAEPDYLVLEGSANRAAALVGGDIQATIVQLEDWLVATGGEEDDVHVLADIASQLPDLTVSAYAASSPWVEDNEDVLSAFLAHLLVNSRTLNDDPDQMRTLAVDYLDGVEASAIDLLVDSTDAIGGLYFEDGGLTLDKVGYSIDFFVETEGLEAGLEPGDVADLGPLEGAVELADAAG